MPANNNFINWIMTKRGGLSLKLGAQLFTVHDYTKNLDDFAESLKKVADIGYKVVQVSGTCEFEAQWLKEQLDKTDLSAR